MDSMVTQMWKIDQGHVVKRGHQRPFHTSTVECSQIKRGATHVEVNGEPCQSPRTPGTVGKKSQSSGADRNAMAAVNAKSGLLPMKRIGRQCMAFNEKSPWTIDSTMILMEGKRSGKGKGGKGDGGC